MTRSQEKLLEGDPGAPEATRASLGELGGSQGKASEGVCRALRPTLSARTGTCHPPPVPTLRHTFPPSPRRLVIGGREGERGGQVTQLPSLWDIAEGKQAPSRAPWTTPCLGLSGLSLTCCSPWPSLRSTVREQHCLACLTPWPPPHLVSFLWRPRPKG